MKMKWLFFLFIIFSFKDCLADLQDVKFPKTIFPYGGYVFNDKNRIELGIGSGYRFMQGYQFIKHDISVFHIACKPGLEMSPNNSLYVPKIALESNFFIVSARLSLLYEITKYGNKLKLFPEMGFCLGSYVNVMFQFEGLKSGDVPIFSSQKISININIPLNFPEKK